MSETTLWLSGDTYAIDSQLFCLQPVPVTMAARSVKMNSVSLLSAKLLDGWTMLADGCPDCQVHAHYSIATLPAKAFDASSDPS